VEDQSVGKGNLVVRPSRGIKKKKTTPILIKSSQKLRSPQLRSITPRKTVGAKSQKSPTSLVVQNPEHNDSFNSDSSSQCNEKKFENTESSKIVTEKIRPSESSFQTESLGVDSQDLSKNKNPFLRPKIFMTTIDRDLPDTNEAQFSILQTNENSVIRSLRTGYDPKTPTDSNYLQFKRSQGSPEIP
jgi:hypothetical protein